MEEMSIHIVKGSPSGIEYTSTVSMLNSVDNALLICSVMTFDGFVEATVSCTTVVMKTS